MTDEVSRFTEEEFRAALRPVMALEDINEYVKTLLASTKGVTSECYGFSLSPDLLDLLSLVSDSSSAKVATILGLTPTEAKLRRVEFKRRLGLG